MCEQDVPTIVSSMESAAGDFMPQFRLPHPREERSLNFMTNSAQEIEIHDIFMVVGRGKR
jgi:hypothetical protein